LDYFFDIRSEAAAIFEGSLSDVALRVTVAGCAEASSQVT
jgi:hypothetical protein